MRKAENRGPRSKSVPSRRKMALLLAAVAVPLPALPALGANRTYTGPTGLWSNTLNWNPAGIPISTDSVFLQTSGSNAVTVTYDGSVTNTTIASLTIDTTNTGNIALFQSTNSLTIAGIETIGSSGIGSLVIIGGTHTISGAGNFSRIGFFAGSSGALQINGGSFITPEVDAGIFGSASLIQNGGTITTSFLSVGNGATGHGTSAFNGGLLTVNNTWTIGGNGIGTVNQSGGTASIRTVTLGAGATGIGTYNLSNGASLTVSNAATIGSLGQGLYRQTGGQSAFNGGLTIAASAGSSGTFTISGGNVTSTTITLNDNGVFNLGNLGSGGLIYTTFTQAGGTFSAGFNESISFTANASFIQTGGTHDVAGNLMISPVSASGTYSLSNGVLSASNMFIGGNNSSNSGFAGALNASAGASVTVDNLLKVWNASSRITIAGGGTVSAGSLDLAGDTNRLTWTAGTLSISGTSGLTIEPGTPTFGNSITINTSRRLDVGQRLVIGDTADGTYTQTGGTSHIAFAPNGFDQRLDFGAAVGSSGSGTLSGGTLLVDRTTFVGHRGSGTFNQSGGNFQADLLILGGEVGASGTFRLTGGTLTTLSATFVGDRGNGTFNQSGGIHNVDELDVGADFFNPNSSVVGTYSMSSGASLNVASRELVGGGGTGIFNQTGGVHTLTGTSGAKLFIGSVAGSSGTFNLSGGTLFLPSASCSIGFSGDGVFNQTGLFLHTIIGDTLTIAAGTGTGTLNLLGGQLSANAILLRPGGTFIFGSSTTFPNLDYNTFTQTGGTFNVAHFDSIGFNHDVIYTQTGGVHSTPDALQVGGFVTATATYNLQGGTLSAAKSVNIGRNATFNLQGGALITPSVTVRAGAVLRGFGALNLDSFDSDGTLTAAGGNFALIASSVTNTGTLSNGPGVTLSIIGNNVNHTGNIVANGGGAVNFDVPITNTSGRSITLNGGIVSSPMITNAPGGAITGFGQLAGDFVNNGTAVTFIGPSQIVGNVTNSAAANITIRNSQLLITGATLNNGIIRATSGGSVAFDGGLTGNAVLTSGLIAASSTSYSGAVTLEPGSSLLAPYIQQDSLTLKGIAGNPASYATAALRGRAFGGADSTIRSLVIQTDGIGHPLGTLDIADNKLLLDNAATPFATTVRNWQSAYNNDASAGFGLWDGQGGITSSAAKASAQVDGKITIGYLDGAAQNDFGGTYADLIGGPVLATNQTLLRPSLMGDLNLNGFCDGDDIGIIISLGYFGTGQAPHGWLDGDLNGDGSVDGNDIGLIISTGSYNAAPYRAGKKAAKTAATLTGGTVAAKTLAAYPGDSKFDYIYDGSTGDVKISYDGDPAITQSKPLQRLKLASLGGRFITANLNVSGFGTATNTNTLIDCAQAQGSIPDHYDLGNILPIGLDAATVLNDLTLNWQVLNGGLGVRNGDIQVPEPSAFALIGVSAMGLLARRRSIKSQRPRTRQVPLAPTQ